MTQVNLREQLGTEPVRARVIEDCVTLVEDQVRAKSGLSGAAIKAGYAAVKRIKKGFLPDVIDGMLDDWMDKIQPYYDTWSASAGEGAGFADFLVARSDDVAEDLLAVTDQRAEVSRHKTAKKAYLKLRGSAKKNVVEAVPALGRMIERRLDSESVGA
ncbi:DUF6918 family protein [Haliangium sp.]|uniref:DUF6918 family protein n=1 Tax=Haliangium sp. TaxID=2663208 RepID=UPI003D0DB79A